MKLNLTRPKARRRRRVRSRSKPKRQTNYWRLWARTLAAASWLIWIWVVFNLPPDLAADWPATNSYLLFILPLYLGLALTPIGFFSQSLFRSLLWASLISLSIWLRIQNWLNLFLLILFCLIGLVYEWLRHQNQAGAPLKPW